MPAFHAGAPADAQQSAFSNAKQHSTTSDIRSSSSTIQGRPVTSKSKRTGPSSPARCTISRSSHFVPASEQSAMSLKGNMRSIWTQTHPLDFSLVGHLSPPSKPNLGPDSAARPITVHRHGGLSAVHNVIEQFYNRLTESKPAFADDQQARHQLPHKVLGKLQTAVPVGTNAQLAC